MGYDVCLQVDVGGEYPHELSGTDQHITSNLSSMFRTALGCGIPDFHDKTAGDIIETLQRGIADMKARPEHYQQFNSPNGWGMYEHAVPWLEQLLNNCQASPKAKVYVSW